MVRWFDKLTTPTMFRKHPEPVEGAKDAAEVIETSGGRLRIFLVVLVSVLLVAGTSFALKKLGLGYEAPETAKQPSYARYASYAPGARPGGCSSSGCGVSAGQGSSCCSGGGTSLSLDQVKAGALKYYAAKYGDSDVTVEVKDYGCHQEAEIIKAGTVLKRLSINGNNISEIG